MRSLKTLLTVLGAVTVLVLAGNTVALAATGHSFILGKTNKANKVTTLKRTTNGPALNLVTKSSTSAPFTANGLGKVTNLNADRVDGYDSSALRNTARLFTKSVSVGTSSVTMPINLAPGTYTLGYSAYMVSGGTDTGYAGCYFYSGGTSGTAYYAETRFPTKAGIIPATSGTDIVTIAAGDTLNLYCYSPAAFTTLSNEPIRAYAAPIALTGTTPLRVAPSAARVH